MPNPDLHPTTIDISILRVTPGSLGPSFVPIRIRKNPVKSAAKIGNKNKTHKHTHRDPNTQGHNTEISMLNSTSLGD